MFHYLCRCITSAEAFLGQRAGVIFFLKAFTLTLFLGLLKLRNFQISVRIVANGRCLWICNFQTRGRCASIAASL